MPKLRHCTRARTHTRNARNSPIKKIALYKEDVAKKFHCEIELSQLGGGGGRTALRNKGGGSAKCYALLRGRGVKNHQKSVT